MVPQSIRYWSFVLLEDELNAFLLFTGPIESIVYVGVFFSYF
jgi:hypothetical protein